MVAWCLVNSKARYQWIFQFKIQYDEPFRIEPGRPPQSEDTKRCFDAQIAKNDFSTSRQSPGSAARGSSEGVLGHNVRRPIPSLWRLRQLAHTRLICLDLCDLPKKLTKPRRRLLFPRTLSKDIAQDLANHVIDDISHGIYIVLDVAARSMYGHNNTSGSQIHISILLIGVAADLAFLAECPPNKMLIASHSTRPDGAWFFSDKQYAGSLAIKFYSNRVPQELHQSRTILNDSTSSDIRGCFLQKDGITLNRTLAAIRSKFVASGTPSNLRSILRIHIEFPDVQNGMAATRVLTNPVTGDQDVMDQDSSGSECLGSSQVGIGATYSHIYFFVHEQTAASNKEQRLDSTVSSGSGDTLPDVMLPTHVPLMQVFSSSLNSTLPIGSF
ncbi:MAG: hypothetical protein J3Q66DRAFT_429437 [Benniella sp.]|nr:MAG: hypothetical protein J3Q66DRAFT_429437 [Benniella sp.]